MTRPMTHSHVQGSRIARNIRRLRRADPARSGSPIAALTNIFAPQLEVVGAARSVGLNAPDSPSIMAMRHIGQVFNEFDSDSAAMIVLEGDEPLGPTPTTSTTTLVKRLGQDTKHVEHIQDFWGDPLTAGGSQSKDGKAALVQVYLRGNQGEALSNESVDIIRDIVADTPATARGQGLRHRRRAADHRQLRGRQQGHPTGHRDHLPGHRGDVAVRLPLDRHHAHHARRRSSSNCPPPAGWSPCSRTRASSACRPTRRIC